MMYAIIVDASVARSAGTSGKPEPETCRRVLEAIRDSGHKVAMSHEVQNEWMKLRSERSVGQSRSYASNIAIQWLKDMYSSGHVVNVVLANNSELRQRSLEAIQNHPQFSSSAKPLAKDFHLVETALLADQRVISLDRKMFKHLEHLQEIANEVCTIMWVIPVHDQAVEWLRAGAPDEPDYHVCNAY